MSCGICRRQIKRGLRCSRSARIHDSFSADGRSDGQAITAAMQEAYRDDLFRCYYTGLECDTEDSRSPLYRSIDHRTPGDRTDLVVCCIFVNEMKCDLDEEEFRTVIRQLARRFNTGELPDLTEVTFRHRKRNWTGRQAGTFKHVLAARSTLRRRGGAIP